MVQKTSELCPKFLEWLGFAGASELLEARPFPGMISSSNCFFCRLKSLALLPFPLFRYEAAMTLGTRHRRLVTALGVWVGPRPLERGGGHECREKYAISNANDLG